MFDLPQILQPLGNLLSMLYPPNLFGETIIAQLNGFVQDLLILERLLKLVQLIGVVPLTVFVMTYVLLLPLLLWYRRWTTVFIPPDGEGLDPPLNESKDDELLIDNYSEMPYFIEVMHKVSQNRLKLAVLCFGVPLPLFWLWRPLYWYLVVFYWSVSIMAEKYFWNHCDSVLMELEDDHYPNYHPMYIDDRPPPIGYSGATCNSGGVKRPPDSETVNTSIPDMVGGVVAVDNLIMDGNWSQVSTSDDLRLADIGSRPDPVTEALRPVSNIIEVHTPRSMELMRKMKMEATRAVSPPARKPTKANEKRRTSYDAPPKERSVGTEQPKSNIVWNAGFDSKNATQTADGARRTVDSSGLSKLLAGLNPDTPPIRRVEVDNPKPPPTTPEPPEEIAWTGGKDWVTISKMKKTATKEETSFVNRKGYSSRKRVPKDKDVNSGATQIRGRPPDQVVANTINFYSLLGDDADSTESPVGEPTKMGTDVPKTSSTKPSSLHKIKGAGVRLTKLAMSRVTRAREGADDRKQPPESITTGAAASRPTGKVVSLPKGLEAAAKTGDLRERKIREKSRELEVARAGATRKLNLVRSWLHDANDPEKKRGLADIITILERSLKTEVAGNITNLTASCLKKASLVKAVIPSKRPNLIEIAERLDIEGDNLADAGASSEEPFVVPMERDDWEDGVSVGEDTETEEEVTGVARKTPLKKRRTKGRPRTGPTIGTNTVMSFLIVFMSRHVHGAMPSHRYLNLVHPDCQAAAQVMLPTNPTLRATKNFLTINPKCFGLKKVIVKSVKGANAYILELNESGGSGPKEILVDNVLRLHMDYKLIDDEPEPPGRINNSYLNFFLEDFETEVTTVLGDEPFVPEVIRYALTHQWTLGFKHVQVTKAMENGYYNVNTTTEYGSLPEEILVNNVIKLKSNYRFRRGV